jgi:hypothetical protein
MGFPLDRGSVEDGILTCHWHHARFDLASGCTFDLWADDVPTCPVEVRGAEVWVTPTFGYADPAAHWRGRLHDGLAHNLGLVIAKAVQGQLAAGVPPAGAARQIVLFGARHGDGWGVGLTIFTALGNLLPVLPEEETYLALFHGARRVAADCEGQAPRRERAPLASSPDLATLKRWLRRWTAVRHREAAERTLLTAIAAGASPEALASLLLDAETDRTFAGGGHSLDFINKAFECLDLIGWAQAGDVLPTVVGQMVAARGAEESTSWRQPEDLVSLCQTTVAELPSLFAAGRGRERWLDHAALAHLLLGDDAVAIMAALKAAIRAGASPTDLGRSLAYAAALRVARFGSANEHPTGRQPITSSPTPTPSTGCSSGSRVPIRTVNSRPCAASCTARWHSTSHVISTCRRPESLAMAATSALTICPPMPRRSASLCSMPSTGSGRSIWRHVSWHAISRLVIHRRR